MKYDIILAGVGGQGILSIAFVIDNAALEAGLFFKQAEVHGMSQRGGAVQSHLRLSDTRIYSDLIPLGEADMILSVEPLETLRYFEYLKPEGAVVSSTAPYVNIPDYPPLEEIFKEIRKAPVNVLIDSEKLAKEAGSIRAQNMVMLGAASVFLPLREEHLKKYIEVLFERRGAQLVQNNLKAFELGRQAALQKH
ncbi:MAG: indolepyruvate oxidoreductase subunit beta [Candidatus Aminicenantes bacterium]|jgi:indolepyruvate ferredoxin oxidoreductase beta subunit|nr:indolepyruvate oxidoreductase subunit beta [Candidatus Aminicenantes bacterium]